MSREYTNKLYDMLDGCMISYEVVVIACLKYMSEDDVKDMMEHNKFINNESDEEE